MTTQTHSATFRYSHTIGIRRTTGPGFDHPVAMARDEEDRMYVVSRSREHRPDAIRVTMCNVDAEYIGEFANCGFVRGDAYREGSLLWPASVALDNEGNVYVVDEWLNRIFIFTGDGEVIGQWGTQGLGDGEINGPSGIAFDPENNLYLVDSKNNRIQKFTQNGQFICKWGQEGTGDGELNLPWGIDIDSNGDVYVADWRNDRVQKFTSDGQFLMKFGISGSGDGEFNRPTGLAVDEEGIIYVTDWRNDRLQVFDRDGAFITKMTGDATISKWGGPRLDANPDMWKQREVAHGLEREKLFWWPTAVEVDGQGRIFVVESARHRIQVYRKIPSLFLGLYDNARL